MNQKSIVFILGPTCVGKTSLSLFLAEKFNTEILSCDSRQFYKELKIGTSMPTIKELSRIPHHFIGHLSIHQIYNAKLFERDSLNKISKLFTQYSILIMVGGSGLYEKAVTEGLSEFPKIDLDIKNHLIHHFKKKGIYFLQKEFLKFKKPDELIDISNPRRLIRYLEIVKSTGKSPSFFYKKKKKRNFLILKIGLTMPRCEIDYRINNRVDNMMKIGLLDEAKLYYHYRNLNSLQTIGYQEIFEFISEKKNNLNESIEKIKKNTRKYAKRQLTWYKKDTSIIWFHPKEKDKIFDFILKKTMGNTGFEPVTPCL
ncbi:tRNA (adenosine(37)-N6)-dimethylallyltransferase MiaA [Blattabacterium sp. (Blaberus giganteus)]|uniref:tRNA (adenosine(37)-N6)-dimethylallyltransferase MiaA n=1 Tax=Blattabacterium sp. (Blaberus giganteus) TaxID=1186051 RepID=UPI00025F6FC4|nr:tRNA (adenosine(37)-N6)-dimethylallyltransferase MiaA [Blattabacterium sp. (Blaberus giganteus)]AFJ90880.1 tRNA delta(2)-isopentenylpyrophosphate transferase [Blattabacterium sp. (Blaberus giganteus)]